MCKFEKRESCDMAERTLKTPVNPLGSNTVKASKRPLPTTTTRSVSFSSIEVREYPICIGDNPGSTRGCPISIGWEHKNSNSFSVDEYETLTEQTRPDGSSGRAVVISPMERFQMLLRSKLYSNKDIMNHLKRVNLDRERREETVKNLANEEQDLVIEGIKRAIMNATLRRSAKKQERELLKPYRFTKVSSTISSCSSTENESYVSSIAEIP